MTIFSARLTPTPSVTVIEENAAPRPLALHQYHSDSHDWRTSSGVRQLALDLLITCMGENPTPEDVKKKYLGVGAWLPHLAYAKYLEAALQGVEQWDITRVQVRDWLDDWMTSKHKEEAETRYDGTYIGEPFLDWNARLNDILEQMHDIAFDTRIVELPHRIVAYLSGYTPDTFCLDWILKTIRKEKRSKQ